MNGKARLRVFLPLLIDVFAPLVIYYLLHRCGVGEFWALTIGIGLTFVTHNARFLLVKPSLFIAVSAVYVLATTFARPILLASVEPFATRGEPHRLALWENAWSHSPHTKKR